MPRSLLLLVLLCACEPDALYKEEPGREEPSETTSPRGAAPRAPFEVERPVLRARAASQQIECTNDEVRTLRPLDLVLVVDNSCSMAEEIVEVQSNINQSLAAMVEESGIDYRVIVLSLHGELSTSPSASVRRICVSEPLSDGSCDPVPAAPAINDRFFHYSAEVGSRDAWCQVLMTLDARIPDQYGLAPDGWVSAMREDSIKSFIVMTDDGVNCFEVGGGWIQDDNTGAGGEGAAQEFDRRLRTEYPGYFDDRGERAYVWHSVVGMDPDAPRDGIVEDVDPEATAAGTGHQALSLLTGGLRFPIAEPGRFGALFQSVAEASIDTVIERTCN